MKNETKKRLKAIVATVLACATIIGISAFAASTHRIENIEVVYDNISVFVNGKKIDMYDVDGNVVEPFIYNGTTYLPVRAIGNAFDEEVAWDNSTKTVYVGYKSDENSWIKQCSPYKLTSRITSASLVLQPQSIVMGGKNYSDGLLMESSVTGSYALFNLNGKFNSLSLTVGHVDTSSTYNGTLSVYLDEKLSFTEEIKHDTLPKSITIPLDGALHMKIAMTGDNVGSKFGLVQGKFE